MVVCVTHMLTRILRRSQSNFHQTGKISGVSEEQQTHCTDSRCVSGRTLVAKYVALWMPSNIPSSQLVHIVLHKGHRNKAAVEGRRGGCEMTTQKMRKNRSSDTQNYKTFVFGSFSDGSFLLKCCTLWSIWASKTRWENNSKLKPIMRGLKELLLHIKRSKQNNWELLR